MHYTACMAPATGRVMAMHLVCINLSLHGLCYIACSMGGTQLTLANAWWRSWKATEDAAAPSAVLAFRGLRVVRTWGQYHVQNWRVAVALCKAVRASMLTPPGCPLPAYSAWAWTLESRKQARSVLTRPWAAGPMQVSPCLSVGQWPV